MKRITQRFWRRTVVPLLFYLKQSLDVFSPEDAVRGLTPAYVLITVVLTLWWLASFLVPGTGFRIAFFWIVIPLWTQLLILWILIRWRNIRPHPFYVLQTMLSFGHLILLLFVLPSPSVNLWSFAFLMYSLYLVVAQRTPSARPLVHLASLALLPVLVYRGVAIEGETWLFLNLLSYVLSLMIISAVLTFHHYQLRERSRLHLDSLRRYRDLRERKSLRELVQYLAREALQFLPIFGVAVFKEQEGDSSLMILELESPISPEERASLQETPREEWPILLYQMGFVVQRELRIRLGETMTLSFLFFQEKGKMHDDPQYQNLFREFSAFLQTLLLSRQEVETLREEMVRDPLTGVRSRRFLERDLGRILYELDRKRTEQPDLREGVALLVLDLDHFKNVNDTYGHPAGDAVLVELVHRLEQALRKDDRDWIYRYGGEEFVVILRYITVEAAQRVAERIRRAVADQPFTVRINGKTLNIPLTVSIGGSLYPQDTVLPDKLIQHADERLYHAKRLGRNRVIWYDPAEPR